VLAEGSGPEAGQRSVVGRARAVDRPPPELAGGQAINIVKPNLNGVVLRDGEMLAY